ncbi:MAG: hypothetical protein NT117_14520 [Gammaproteobacteria bacterium]|nr:hypothetical protein [Gammaproteobacteria bacterium]
MDDELATAAAIHPHDHRNHVDGKKDIRRPMNAFRILRRNLATLSPNSSCEL